MKSYKEEVLSSCSECKRNIKVKDIYYFEEVPLCNKCYNQLMQDMFDSIELIDEYFKYGIQAWDY